MRVAHPRARWPLRGEARRRLIGYPSPATRTHAEIHVTTIGIGRIVLSNRYCDEAYTSCDTLHAPVSTGYRITCSKTRFTQGLLKFKQRRQRHGGRCQAECELNAQERDAGVKFTQLEKILCCRELLKVGTCTLTQREGARPSISTTPPPPHLECLSPIHHTFPLKFPEIHPDSRPRLGPRMCSRIVYHHHHNRVINDVKFYGFGRQPEQIRSKA